MLIHQITITMNDDPKKELLKMSDTLRELAGKISPKDAAIITALLATLWAAVKLFQTAMEALSKTK